MLPPRHIPSPCVKICVLDPDTRMCRGCFRTIDEVAEWVEYSPEEKLAVLERVAQRKKEAGTT